jgi:uncharacterized protein (DUF2384 family)
MSIEIPSMSKEDAEELQRLLPLAFQGDEVKAKEWLTSPSELWRGKPVDVLRDEIGVVRIISYLKQAAGVSAVISYLKDAAP